MGEFPAAELTREERRYYQLNALVVYSLLLALFCLPSRSTAWGGWMVAGLGLATFFFYHFMTRVQLGLLEFMLTMVLLGHSLILTVTLLWPVFAGTELDWLILPATMGVAVWVLGGALWCGWVVRTLKLESGWERLQVLVMAWLVPVAFPGLLVSFFLTLAGIPTYVLQYLGLRKCYLAYTVYDWWVLPMPVLAFICYKVTVQVWGLHATARAMQPEEDLVAHAVRFGSPADPIAPDPRAAVDTP